ncbi:copper transporter crmD [Penicillium malachiteum]|nr:copper transporter crmD [Penicillium malachiteum]
MDPSEHATHGISHSENHDHMEMTMSMVFTLSTKVTILFSWWTTTTTISYVISLLFLFVLALFNRFLGVWKPQLIKKPSDFPDSSVPKLSLPPSRWYRNRSFKDHVSPLPLQIDDHRNDTEGRALPSAPLLGPTTQLYPEPCEQDSDDDHCPRFFRSFRPHRRWNWAQDITGSLLEGIRALTGYTLMLAVMTYNVGILGAVLAGIIVGEMLLGRFSLPSSGWQDGACHDG